MTWETKESTKVPFTLKWQPGTVWTVRRSTTDNSCTVLVVLSLIVGPNWLSLTTCAAIDYRSWPIASKWVTSPLRKCLTLPQLPLIWCRGSVFHLPAQCLGPPSKSSKSLLTCSKMVDVFEYMRGYIWYNWYMWISIWRDGMGWWEIQNLVWVDQRVYSLKQEKKH